MSKNIFLISLIFFFLESCKKETAPPSPDLKEPDTTPPILTISSGTMLSQSLPSTLNGGIWTSPTATAQDDQDGDISSAITISGIVNPNIKGVYNLIYSVSDAAGNTASQTVTVVIYNDCDFLSGAYIGDDSCQSSTVFPYFSNIIPSTTINKEFNIQNFGSFGSTIYIKASINGNTSGSSIIWGAQPLGASSTLNSYTVTSSGTLTNTTPVTFTLPYQWTDGTNSEICTSIYTRQ